MSHITFTTPHNEELTPNVLPLSSRTTSGNICDFGPMEFSQAFLALPSALDADFVARPEIMDWLWVKCAQPASCVALVGLPGVGKSQIVVQHVHKVQQQSPDIQVFWVRASSRDRFEESYRNIAHGLHLPGWNDPKGNLVPLVHDWLRDTEKGAWVMILDDVGHIEDVFSGQNAQNKPPPRVSLPRSSCGSIIITSSKVSTVDSLVHLNDMCSVPKMKESQALQLLRNKLGKGYHESTAEKELVNVLGYMPLAIIYATAFIKQQEQRVSLSKYLEQFRRSDEEESLIGQDALLLLPDITTSNATGIAWKISFEHIRREKPSAADLLSFMSFCHCQGVPENLLQAYNTEQTKESKDEFDEDIETLHGYSLMRKTLGGDSFELHSLGQLFAKAWLSKFDNIEQWEQQFLRKMSNLYPSEDDKRWIDCQRLEAHIASIVQERLDSLEDDLSWAQLLMSMGKYRFIRGTYREAEILLRRAVVIREKILGWENSLTLLSAETLVLVCQAQSKYEQAEKVGRRVLDGMERVLGRKHSSTLRTLANLALILQHRGNYEDAELMSRRAFIEREEVLGKEHLDTLTSLGNLAFLLQVRNKHKEAEQINQQALESRERVLGKDHPDTLASIHNFGSILLHQSKYDKARQQYERAHSIRERNLGQDHPQTLTSLSGIASVLQHQGKYREAEQFNQRILKLREISLGQEHPDTLTTVNNLALVLRSLGKYKESEQLHRRGIETSEKVLGRDHPATLTAVHNLALVLQDQGENEEAEQMNQRDLETCERLFGSDHPDTLASMQTRVLLLQFRGRFEEAERITRRVVKAREMVLGRDHSDTLASTYNLAYLCHKQARCHEAAELYERTYSGFVRILGSDHPTTKSCASNRDSLMEYMKTKSLEG